MEFRVLGPVEVRRDGHVEVLSGLLRRTLLGMLLVRDGQAVPVDVLTDTLWGDPPDPRAAQKLQLHIHRLRGVLDDPARLSFDAAGYRLRAHWEEVDAAQFEALVDAGVAVADRQPQQAIESLRAALALWRGVPFADVEVPVIADWARRLTERRMTALEVLYQAELACGLHEAVIGELSDLVRGHPLRERLYALLMTALHRAGRRAEALAVYRQARDTLVAELGLEPGPELAELHRRVLTDDETGETGGETAPDEAARRDLPAHLPVDVRGFVGREAELAELDGLLPADTPVLVSVLAGTAGVGKTALAVRWAHRVRDRFPDGQLYVDLRGYGPDEPVSAADALAGFLRALGLDGTAIPEDPAERAARFRTLVDGRAMLIVLDNARTVEQVRPLLSASPHCFTVVTSRDSLAGLVAREGAHRITLDRLPPADSAGLLRALLGARADAEPAAVGTLVERCAGLPLALRITAELVRSRPSRTVGQLADELAEAQDALDLLDIAGDPHTAVRAVFSWSYGRLDPAVARMFRLLGRHPGPDAAAHAVAAMAGAGLRETRRALDVLVRAHLVDRTAGDRYQMHDLLRAYAAELADAADDTTAALARLFDHYLATAAAAMDVIAPHESGLRPKVPATGAERPAFDTYGDAFGWLDAERANLLATTQHAEPGHVIALSETVWRYLTAGHYKSDAVTLHTRAMRAAQTLGDRTAEAHARRALGAAMAWTGDPAEAIGHLTLAFTLYEQLGDRLMQASTLNNTGIVHWRRGDLAAAADTWRRSIAFFRESADPSLCVPAMNNLGRVLSLLRRYDEAADRYEQVLAIARDNGNRISETMALFGLSVARAGMDRHQEALAGAQDALSLAQSVGSRGLECLAMRALGIAHRGLHQHEPALRHLDSALAVARLLGDAEMATDALNELAATHAATGNLPEALRRYHEALAENGPLHRHMYAHALAGIGDVHAELGEHDHARESWQQALVVYRALGMPHADDMAARLSSPAGS